ncbi:hypothetical protein D3C80_1848950 [compost metagenome]
MLKPLKAPVRKIRSRMSIWYRSIDADSRSVGVSTIPKLTLVDFSGLSFFAPRAWAAGASGRRVS